MGRLRAELTEQLSSEMLVERIVMRTQASRLPADAGRLENSGRTLEPGWADDVPPRELTGGWPAVRLDEPRETQQFEQVRVERTGPRPPVPPRAGLLADHRARARGRGAPVGRPAADAAVGGAGAGPAGTAAVDAPCARHEDAGHASRHAGERARRPADHRLPDGAAVPGSRPARRPAAPRR